MTTETERRVPEHPGWQPWFVRMVDYGGRVIVLEDDFDPSGCVCVDASPERYGVLELVGRQRVEACPDCGETYLYGAYHELWLGDSLAEAEAAFAEACERLREGA